jgi:hypothetical protein
MTETRSLTLAEFLLARIDEDETVARESFYEGQHWYAEEESVQSWPGGEDDDRVWMADRKRDAQHVVNWQPVRVLAECEAKRGVVGLLAIAEEQYQATRLGAADYADVARAQITRDALLRAVQFLALPYADHPDYREEWRP